MEKNKMDSFDKFLSEDTISLVDYILKITDEKTLKDEFIESILSIDIEEDSDVEALFSCYCSADSYGYTNSLHVLKFGNPLSCFLGAFSF